MERIVLEILAVLRAKGNIEPKELDRILNDANRRAHSSTRRFAKKRIFPYYLDVKDNDPARWESWNVTPLLERQFMAAVRMKPRRTASGVATITVITKPWRCSSNCLYCPADVRMPKSYLADEPACQRAERNWFDPYLQMASRLRALVQMGHVTDKVEVIVLGGGVSKAGAFLLGAVRQEVPKYLLFKGMPYARIELARLGADAGIIGAAMLGRHA